MPRRSKKQRYSSSRDSKVDRIKKALLLLASRGYFTKGDISVLNRSVFEWYCGVAGGVVVRVGRRVVCMSQESSKVIS
jgi:hypothetical protein